MIDLFVPIRGFLKYGNVSTDNTIFRMHYRVTVVILLIFTLMVTSKQFFGEPIHCMSNGDKDADKEAVNSYCWIYGTYTLKSQLTGKSSKTGIYPGVGPKNGDEGEVWQTYYQWVCFVLLGQAASFYIPRYLWKVWEGGRLKALASDLGSPIVSKEWAESRRSELVSYLSHSNMYMHNMYALRYAVCEIFNLINVIAQIFLLDIFLNGAFRNYGTAVASFLHTPRVPQGRDDFPDVNPMDQYFPKLTKCWLRFVGPSGSPEYRDRLCVLPLNIVNEKIFIIIWFWFIFLAFISTLAVIFRILVFSFVPLRTLMIMGQLKHMKRSVVSKLVTYSGFGDWFVLYLLGKNMNPVLYKDLVTELANELDPKMVMV